MCISSPGRSPYENINIFIYDIIIIIRTRYSLPNHTKPRIPHPPTLVAPTGHRPRPASCTTPRLEVRTSTAIHIIYTSSWRPTFNSFQINSSCTRPTSKLTAQRIFRSAFVLIRWKMSREKWFCSQHHSSALNIMDLPLSSCIIYLYNINNTL